MRHLIDRFYDRAGRRATPMATARGRVARKLPNAGATPLAQTLDSGITKRNYSRFIVSAPMRDWVRVSMRLRGRGDPSAHGTSGSPLPLHAGKPRVCACSRDRYLTYLGSSYLSATRNACSKSGVMGISLRREERRAPLLGHRFATRYRSGDMKVPLGRGSQCRNSATLRRFIALSLGLYGLARHCQARDLRRSALGRRPVRQLSRRRDPRGLILALVSSQFGKKDEFYMKEMR